jgi:predicted nicotinamide N-methyase
VSGGAPSGYVLEAGSSPGLADIAVAPLSATGFVAPNVPTGRYYVRVRATNAAGSSPPTSDREVVVP